MAALAAGLGSVSKVAAGAVPCADSGGYALSLVGLLAAWRPLSAPTRATDLPRLEFFPSTGPRSPRLATNRQLSVLAAPRVRIYAPATYATVHGRVGAFRCSRWISLFATDSAGESGPNPPSVLSLVDSTEAPIALYTPVRIRVPPPTPCAQRTKPSGDGGPRERLGHIFSAAVRCA